MKIIGHRGGLPNKEGNTIKSFQKAIDDGATIIEFDVHMSKDCELIVTHDQILKHHGKSCYIYDMTYDQIKDNYDDILTLAETLAFLRGKVIALIEIKNTKSDIYFENVFTGKIVSLLECFIRQNNGWTYENIMLQSFNQHYMNKINHLNISFLKGIILYGMPYNTVANAVDLCCDFITIDHMYLDNDFIDEAHSNRMKVYTYTVNDPIVIINILKNFSTIDGIITNHVKTMKSYVE